MTARAAAVLLLVAWGAGAFGAVYPWAYVPLYAGCAAYGAAVLAFAARRTIETRLVVAVCGVLAAAAVQLIPLPVAVLQRVSPAADRLLRSNDLAYSMSPAPHPLSIDPQATLTAVLAAAALAIFLLGLSATLNRATTRQIVRGVIVIGVILALAGMAQAALWNGKIYGFWTPREEGNPFGPFPNRNHFAGWMLLAIPLGIGYLCERVAKAMARVAHRWRDRVLWLSSPEASETVLIAFGLFVMAVALVLTTSRLGILGLVGALAVTAWVVVKKQPNTGRRLVVAGYLVMLLVASIAWTGLDRLAARFGRRDAVTLGSRTGAWKDTGHISADFPVAGTGLDTYGTAMLFYQTEQGRHYMQAHNDYLQLFAEGGLLVFIPVVALGATAVSIVRRRLIEAGASGTDWTRIGAATGMVAIGVQELGDFSLQIPGNGVLFCVLWAIAMSPADAPRPPGPRVRSGNPAR